MTTKLQVPIDSEIKDALEKRAHSLGFDSTQAYIRVWAKAEVEGRKLNFDDMEVVLSPEAVRRYEKMSEELDKQKKQGKVKAYTSTSEFMKDLR